MSINAGAAIASRAVKPVSEVVSEDAEFCSFGPAILCHKRCCAGVCSECVDALHGGSEGPEDPRHLGVLVDEEERVGDVSVAEVHNAEAEPPAGEGAADFC